MIKKGSRYRVLNDHPWKHTVRGQEMTVQEDEKYGMVLCLIHVEGLKPFAYPITDFEKGRFIPFPETEIVKEIMSKYE